MVTFCLGCGRGKSILMGVAALATTLLLTTRPGAAATILRGQVLDQIASFAVAGATVEVHRGDSTLGVASSDRDGFFSLALGLPITPQVQNLTLFVKHPGFEDRSEPVIVASGDLDRDFYKIELFPLSLARCRLQYPHAVVVGYFRSPIAGEKYRDLSSRIADALTYNLLTRLQAIHVPGDLQPVFLECEEARPRTVALSGAFARALGADAFLSGDVNPDGAQFKVSTYVSDRFGLFVPPFRTVNEKVDLHDPGVAQLDPSTHAAVLVSVATAYHEQERYPECVEVSVAAERLASEHNSAIQNTAHKWRELCQEQLGNRGLLRGTGP